MMIDKLRDEIIESEKARTDLLKWKLILVAALGAAGLGIGSTASTEHQRTVLLALIPFVCLYVDAVCFHNDIRIMTIGRFLRTRDAASVERAYEEYCAKNRSHFSLESFALLWTTVGLSAAVLVIGLSPRLQSMMGMPLDSKPEAHLALARGFLAWSGGIGMVTAVLFYRFYRHRTQRLDRPAND